jgi:hypothetical protein
VSLAERTDREILCHLQERHYPLARRDANPRRARNRPPTLPGLVQPSPASPAPRRAHPRSGLGRQDAARTAALPLRVEWTPHRLPLALVAALATATLETDIECPGDAVPARHDRPSQAMETEVNRTAITGSEASSRP